MNSSQLRLDEELLNRVYGEFREMPGLRLTSQQAQRLWGLDERTCAKLLQVLVDTCYLCRSERGLYARPTGERTTHRMLKSRIDDDGARTREAR